MAGGNWMRFSANKYYCETTTWPEKNKGRFNSIVIILLHKFNIQFRSDKLAKSRNLHIYNKLNIHVFTTCCKHGHRIKFTASKYFRAKQSYDQKESLLSRLNFF